MSEEEKNKIKTVLVDYLTTLGYPDMTVSQIMSHLKPMWIKLEEAGLIVQGMNFPEFAMHAQQKAIEAQLRDFLKL